MKQWNKLIPATEIQGRITEATVEFANEFGSYLAVDDLTEGRNGRSVVSREKLTTSQLRKFFGEVKRQQMTGYDETDLVLLKPKLAYAVGRANKNALINDFYMVIADAIDKVKCEEDFKRFIKIFEAIVAYHKKAEADNKR